MEGRGDKSGDQVGGDDGCGQNGHHRGGGKNQTLFLGSWDKEGANSYSREVREEPWKDGTSDLHFDSFNMLLESKRTVQKRRRKEGKTEARALY